MSLHNYTFPMATRNPQVSQQIRVGYLDSARALAILSVILVHTGSAAEAMSERNGKTLIPEFIFQITDLGKFGVQLFFLLSGILVTRLYKVDNSHATWKRQFVTKRFARILPLWTAFLVLQIGLYLSPLRDWSSLQNLNAAGLDTTLFLFGVAFLTMTFTLWVLPELWNTVIAGGWSIQVEIAHYLLFLFLNTKSLRAWMWMLCLSQAINFLAFAATLAPSSILKWGGEAILRFGICNSFLFFALGVIAVRLVESQKRSKSGIWFGAELAWPALGAFAFMVLTPGNLADNLIKSGFVASSLIVAFLLSNVNRFQPLIGEIARYSYFMYFCHFWVLAVIFRIYERYGSTLPLTGYSAVLLLLVVYLIATGTSLAIGFLSFRIFERPAQNWIVRQGSRLVTQKAKG